MSTTAKVELANTWSLELHLGLLPWGRQGPKHLSHCLLTLGCTVAGGRNGGGADTRSRHPKQWLTDSSPDACPLELMSFTRRDTQSSLSCTHLPTSPSPARLGSRCGFGGLGSTDLPTTDSGFRLQPSVVGVLDTSQGCEGAREN